MNDIARAVANGKITVSAAALSATHANIELNRRCPNTLVNCTCRGPFAFSGQDGLDRGQLHEAWMHHYVTQAGSKAKPNGCIVKAGSNAACRTAS
jgi:hypothetical protein